MRNRLTFIALLVLTFCPALLYPAGAQARTETIAAVVNNDVISMSDIEDRMKLIIVSAGLPDTDEIRNKLMTQIVSSLVEEQLKLQEARRLGLEVSQEEADRGFAAIAAQNKLTPEQFWGLLAKSGINTATMERQIRSQIAWSKIVQTQIRPKISVNDREVDDMLARLVSSAGSTEYRVAEIFLPVEDPKNENDVQQLASRLDGEIHAGKAPFFKVAQQFSKSAGAAQGGDIGWVRQGQLPDELEQVLVTMNKDEISQPVRSVSGYHILYLREKREITSENIPSRDQIMGDLGTQSLERMQRRYYMDLKASAFIENRV